MEEERAAWPQRDRRSEPPAADWRPAGDYQPILWREYAADLTRLADRLVAAGVPFYLRPREVEDGRTAGYEIRVRQEERELALRELEALQRAGSADPAAEVARPIDDNGAAPAGPPASTESRPGCPACGAAVTVGAAECPDCGLVLGGAE